jgi:phosphohistidine phosphatase
MARWMKQRGLCPDLALISRAKRTEDTWKLLKQEGVNAGITEKLQRLYHASSGELLQIIQSVDPENRSLLIIGHNPGLHILVKSLLNQEDSATDGALYDKFPTSAFAHITFEAENWSDVAPLCGKLYRYMTPKRLSSQEFTLDDYLDR